MMKNAFNTLLVVSFVLLISSCGKKGGGSSKGGSTYLNDFGQNMGLAPLAKKSMPNPYGMVYVPPGTFHLGASDEDMNYNLTSRNRQVSIPGFWMDKYEVTNNQYRAFVTWTRDSIAAKELGYFKSGGANAGGDSAIAIDWVKAKTIKYDAANLEKLGPKLVLAPDNRLYGKAEVDPSKIVYSMETFVLSEASKRENQKRPRKDFIKREKVAVYPDTLVWMRDFSYAYNEPMTKRYYAHPAFGNYPVVGVTWKQATAFCHWKTHVQNVALGKKNFAIESDYRLPSEAEWEYAARGSRTASMYPWGNYYLRNKKGCLLANFKPGRGNFAEDGGFYTVRVDSYWPNDYGLYNMSGNVAEWTNTLYNEGSYNFFSDMSPDLRYDAKDSDAPYQKRKTIRGGSWKDVKFYLQVSTRAFEYQDTAKSYIGFRCVIDLAPKMDKKGGLGK
jgi:formylglycine-generating enzyme required for sulfatase activity